MTALPHTLEQLVDILNASNRVATPAGGGGSHDPVTIGAGGLSAQLSITPGQVLTLGNINHSQLSTVGPNDHHNRQHSIIGASDHTVVGSALDVIGLSAANTLGVLTPSANPGANSRLIKSDAGGGLTLQALQVQGAVDITGGGNLTVGTNVLFVNNSGQRIGVNMAADPQFALDVNGNIRWSGWGVGKMAIQISGALMICHYDGRMPYETDYTGTALGHMGQAATWAGGVIFRPGKFGTKAVQLAEATTNLCTNPSFETNTTGWSNAGNDGGYTTFSRSAAGPFIGGWGIVTAPPASPTGQNYVQFSINAGAAETYTVSAWVWVAAGTNSYTLTTVQQGGLDVTTHTPITGTGSWQRVSQTITTVTGTTTLRVRLRHDGTASSLSARWDAVQIEQKAYATPYCDGSLDIAHPLGTNGQHSWSGTVHASTSSRIASHLSYPFSGNINPQLGTVMAWVNLSGLTGGNQTIFRVTSTGHLILRVATNGRLQGFWGANNVADPGSALPINEWVHVAIVCDGTNTYLYKNGVQVATGTTGAVFSGSPASMFVGRAPTATEWLNGLIDDLIIVNRAVSADEIRSIYESDAPVFAETSSFNFTIPNQLVWADENGLFMRRSDGQAALAVIGVDGFSWGGQSLDMGDLLLGNTSGANFFFDISANALHLRSGTTQAISLLSAADAGGRIANFNGVLGIGISGGIYQGTGSFASPTTGLKVWNDSGAGRIAGYNGGTLQSGFDTNGRLIAGAGDVVLDANGIKIRGTTSYNFKNAISWLDAVGGNEETRVWGLVGATAVELNLEAVPAATSSNRSATVNIRATPLGSGNGLIVMNAKTSISAGLSLNTTTDALTVPRMTTTQRNALSGVVNGMVIYNSTTNTFQGRAGGAWVDL